MMLEMPIEEASKAIRLSEPASGSSCGGDAIKSATGKKAAGKGSRLSERASGSSGDGVAIKAQKLAEGDKAEAGKVKRMGLVSKEYIDLLRKLDGGPRVRTFDRLANYTGPQADVLRESAARSTAAMERFRAQNAYILQQYSTYGEVEIEMEEDESWLDDPKRWVLQVARKNAAARKKMASSA